MKKYSGSNNEFTLDRFEGDKAVLLGADGQEIILPAKIFPKDAKEGDALILFITTDKEEKQKKEKLAKEILNEILGGKEIY